MPTLDTEILGEISSLASPITLPATYTINIFVENANVDGSQEWSNLYLQTSGYRYVLDAHYGRIGAGQPSAAGRLPLAAASGLLAAGFHMVTARFDGSDMKYYVDGQPIGTVVSAGNWTPPSQIDVLNGPAGQEFAQKVKDLRLYDGVATDAQILSSYNTNGVINNAQGGPGQNQQQGVSSMYVSRNIKSGSDAVWAFQMAPGRAGNIQRAVYRVSGGQLTLLAANTHSVSEPSAGNYLLNVPSGTMGAGQSGDMYFATLSDGDQFVRVQAWTYDNPAHFSKVISDIADLDQDVQNAVSTLQGNIDSARAALDTEITNAEVLLSNHVTTQVGNAQTAIINDITSAEVTLSNHVTSEVGAAQTAIINDITAAEAHVSNEVSAAQAAIIADVGQAETAIQADIAAVKAETALIVADTNELQSDWADNGRLDLILDDAAADAASAKAKAANIETSLGNLQGLQFDGNAQNDLAGALSTLFTEVDGVEEGIVSAQTAIIADIGQAETLLTTEIGNAKTAIIADITSAEGTITQAISTSEGVVTGAITAQTATLQGNITAAQTAIIQEVDANQTLIGAVNHTKNDASLFGKIADVKSDVANLDSDVVALQGDLTQEISDAGAERTAAGNERTAQAAERVAAGNERTAQAAERSDQGTHRTAQAAFRTAAQIELNKIGNPAGGSVSADIAAIKALLDGTLTNARLLPFVPSSILSPLQSTRLRFTCRCVDGETGAGEQPDNNELGVQVQLTDLSGGGQSNVSGSALFDASSGGSALSAAPGGANRIPTQFYLMNAVGGQLGSFEAFLEIPAYTHGNYEFEFACFDSDPSGSPVSFSRVAFMEVRKNVAFTQAGAF